jgi:hypothetical protein
MAETNPAPAPLLAAETIQYKPLSLFAVSGLIAAILFGVILVAGSIVAMSRGTPFFVNHFVLALPIAGAILGALGLWEINSSEGTRAGMGLAKWAVGLSLVTGIGYVTYEVATFMAVVQQANRFMLEKDANSGFLPRVAGNELDMRTAFLYTLNESQRTVRPENAQDFERLDGPTEGNARGRFTQFTESGLVHLLRRADPSSLKFEPVAVKDWSYDNGTYKIVRVYRISTDEATYEVPFWITSIEPTVEGEKRKWKVDLPDKPLLALNRTPIGEKKIGFRTRGLEFTFDPKSGWVSAFSSRRALDIYLGTQPPADRKALVEKRNTIVELTPLVAAAGATAAPARDSETVETLLAKWLPGYFPLTKAEAYVDFEHMRAFDQRFLSICQQAAKEAFAIGRLPYLRISPIRDDYVSVQFKNGEAIVSLPFEFLATVGEAQATGQLLLIGRVVVAAPESLETASPTSDRQFRVVRAEIERALLQPQKKKGGP